MRLSAGGGSNLISGGWRTGITFLPFGAGPSASFEYGSYSITGSYTLSSCNTASVKRMGSDVCVRQVRIAASGSQSNLDFIDFAHATMANPASQESTTEIMSYDRSQTASTSAIDVSMPAPIDITALWSADKTVIELQMAGQLPEQDWTVDVTLTLSGKIKYEF